MAFQVSKKRKQELINSQLYTTKTDEGISISKSIQDRVDAGIAHHGQDDTHENETAFEDGFIDYLNLEEGLDIKIPKRFLGKDSEVSYINGVEWAQNQNDIGYLKSLVRYQTRFNPNLMVESPDSSSDSYSDSSSDGFGVGGYIASAGTFIFGNATQRMKNFMRDHGEEEITSIKLGRQPIESAIASVMELISLGEFSKSQEKRGYDAFFHLYLILNDKYVLEKNQNVNYKAYTPNDKEEIYDVSLSGLKGKTINEFIKNGQDFMGENKYWQGYNPLVNNCQKWVESNLQANDVDSKTAQDFYYQDTEDLIQAIDPNVQDFLEETTDVASGLEKFISWLSDGAWGFKRGGQVGNRRRIGQMK